MTRPTACYRLRPYFRNAGVMGTAGVAVLGLGSVYAAYFNIDNSFPNPALAVTVFGLFWSCFLFLGVWLLLLYRRYRLYISDESLRQCGVVSDKSIALRTITQVRWRLFPAGGSARVIGVDGGLAIELGNFNKNDRGEVVAFLRGSVPEERQCGWDAFHRQFEDDSERKELSRRGAWLVALAIAGGAIWGLVEWSVYRSQPYLLIALLNTAGAVYISWRLLATSSGSRHGEPGVGADSR